MFPVAQYRDPLGWLCIWNNSYHWEKWWDCTGVLNSLRTTRHSHLDWFHWPYFILPTWKICSTKEERISNCCNSKTTFTLLTLIICATHEETSSNNLLKNFQRTFMSFLHDWSRPLWSYINYENLWDGIQFVDLAKTVGLWDAVLNSTSNKLIQLVKFPTFLRPVSVYLLHISLWRHVR